VSAALAAGLVWLQAVAEQRDEAQDIPEAAALQAVIDAAERRPLPAALDADLAEILGMPNFQAAPIAHLFRDTGAAILPKAEAEQAFVLHWLLGLWFEHGAGFRLAAGEILHDLSAKRRKAAGR
jgi:hypothetical protein